MNEQAVLAPLILVVDDNPLNVEPLCDLLEAMGYRVAQALDGPAALATTRERMPDLILLDIMMPGMNGYEVCSRLKLDPATAKIPIVFVTALSDSEDKLKAIEVGGDDFLTKPFNRPILLARLRSLLRLKSTGDQLEESYRRLQALERLRDDLMKMIVHDLKSPLTAMLATLEMAVDGEFGTLSHDGARLLADAQQRGGEALQLMEDLLELTRLEESHIVLDLQVLEVRTLLSEIVDDWTIRAQRQDATLHLDAGPELVVTADPHLLRRVFSNLVGNALRHAGSGVHVTLSAEAMKGGGLRFAVSDDGAGIPPAYHDLIFHKFGSVQAHASSGLGLTFCKLAVEAHGGRIWVESPEAGGSTFHFVLPSAASAVPVAEPV